MNDTQKEQAVGRPERTGRWYLPLLWILVLLLVAALAACAADGGRKGNDSTAAGKPTTAPGTRTMRLMLAGSEARDSAAVVQEFFVDQALRRVFDSIPNTSFLTLNHRDSISQIAIDSGAQGVTVEELGRRLDLDGVIFTRFARFSSVLALELRIVDPANGSVIYRDLNFSLIRYRDSTGDMLVGPALYDVLRKSVGRYFAVPHVDSLPVAVEPMVVANILIPTDARLGLISARRQELSTLGVKALGEYARLHLPELLAFDYESRNRVYGVVGVKAVDDFHEINDLERRALFSLGIDRYVTGSVRLMGNDSMAVRLELRRVTSPSSDSLLDQSQRIFSRTAFESTRIDRDFIVALIDLAEPMYVREAGRIRDAYLNRSRPPLK